MFVTDNVTILPNAAGGDAFTAAEVGQWVLTPGAVCNYEMTLSNTTTPAAEIEIHGSNSRLTIPGVGTRMGRFKLSGAAASANGSKNMAACKYTCIKVIRISGTNASVAGTVSAAK